MDLQELRTFVSVVNQKSFSAAAVELNVTQPAVSKRIAHLEGRFGVPILDRINRDIRPTPAGQTLYERAKTIISEYEDALTDIRNLSSKVSGNIKISCSHYAGVYYLPDRLKCFLDQYPSVHQEVVFMNSQEVTATVRAADADIGIATLPLESDPFLSSIPLHTEKLRVVVNKNHPLTRMPSPVIKDLRKFNAILPNSDDPIYQDVKRIHDENRLKIEKILWTEYLVTTRAIIQSGLGWGVLPETMIDDSLAVLPVKGGFEFQRTIGFIYNNRRSLSNAAIAFIGAFDR